MKANIYWMVEGYEVGVEGIKRASVAAWLKTMRESGRRATRIHYYTEHGE